MSGATRGHQLLQADIPDRVRDTFWTKVKKSRRCWLWARATNPSGYGILGWAGDNGFECHTAHRVAYALAVGDIPPERVVRITCGTTSCVRPDHLELTDHLGNVRASLARQTRFGMNMAKASEIRERIQAGESDDTLAADYGFRKRRIQLIRLNKTWIDPDYVPVRRDVGEDALSARLTDTDVAEARSRHHGGETVQALAEAYDVGYTTMLDALRYVTWAHVS